MTHTLLMAGFHKTEISPEPGCELSGFVARQGGALGIHDPLWARAVVISDHSRKMVMVAVDLIGLDDQSVRVIRHRVAAVTDIKADHILCCATHTHSGPVSIGRGFLGKVDPKYHELMIERIVQAIVSANQKLIPATLFAGSSLSDIGKNRRHPGGPTDPALMVMRLVSVDTQVMLVNYACHPVVLGPDNLLITADYPYYVIRTLEEVYPDTEVMFVNGATGDINVGHNALDSIQKKVTSKRTFTEAERLGRLLAARAIEAAETSKAYPAETIRVQKAKVKLTYEKVLSTMDYQNLACSYQIQSDGLKANSAGSIGEIRQLGLWSDWARSMAELNQAGLLENSIETEVTAFSIGDLEFVTLPGEFFHQFGLTIRQSRPGKEVFILGYANDTVGYVAPASAYSEGGYEIVDSFRYYGLPSKLEAGSGEKVIETLLNILRSLGCKA